MEAKKIAKLAQIASVLEVSGWPKPGNVHRTLLHTPEGKYCSPICMTLTE